MVFETEYTKYGINQLTAARLIEHLNDDDDLTEAWTSEAAVLEDDEVDLLLELLESLLDRSKSWIEEPETSQIALAPCVGSRYTPVRDAVRVEDDSLGRCSPGLILICRSLTAHDSPSRALRCLGSCRAWIWKRGSIP